MLLMLQRCGMLYLSQKGGYQSKTDKACKALYSGSFAASWFVF